MGSLADRLRSPLRLYAACELLLGLTCLALPSGFDAIAAAVPAISRAWFGGWWRVVVTALLLVPPTLLMGGTLPAVSRWWVRRAAERGSGAGLLYACNMVGGVVGILATGLYLLWAFGLTAAHQAAAIGNLVVGAVAWRLAVGEPERATPLAPSVSAIAPTAPLPGHAARLVASAFAVAGVASMIYEVAWSRALSMVISGSTYTVTLTLATFLAGLVIGSVVSSAMMRRASPGPGLFCGLQIAIAVSTLASSFVIEQAPLWFVRLYAGGAESKVLFLTGRVAVAAALMLVPTCLIGAAVPVTVGLATRLKGFGRHLGRLYAVNTAGNIAGALAAGFWLLPALGTQTTLRLGAAVHLAAAALVGL